MRLLGKIDFALTWYECKKDLASKILTLYQTPTFYQMNLGISMLITKSLNSMTQRKIFGL
jgi:hypothetical protein